MNSEQGHTINTHLKKVNKNRNQNKVFLCRKQNIARHFFSEKRNKILPCV